MKRHDKLLERFRALIEGGRIDDAACELAARLARPWRGRKGLALCRRPKQDLTSGRLRDAESAASDRRALRLAQDAARRWRGSAHIRALVGMLQLFVENPAAAERSLSRALELDANLSWARVLRYAARTMLLRRRKRFFTAAQLEGDFQHVFRAAPDDVWLLALRAEMLHDLEINKEALADLDRILQIDPDHPWAYAERGEILTETGRHEEAMRDFDGLVARFPKEAWSFALRGRARANSGKLSESLVDFDRALGLGNEPVVAAWRGEARRKLGDLPGALRDFNAAIRDKNIYPLAYAWRGRVLMAQGRTEAAVRDFNAALVDPRHTIVFPWRAEALFKLGRYRAAALDLDRAFPFHPRHSWLRGPGQTSAEALRASLLGGTGRSPWFFVFRGRLLLDSENDWGLASDDLNRAIALAPRCAAAHAWRAEALRRAGRLEEALRDGDRAVSLRPNDAFCRFWRGRARMQASDDKGALEDFDALLARHPYFVQGYRFSGEARLRAGLRRAAANDFEMGCFLQAKDADLKAWRDRVRGGLAA